MSLFDIPRYENDEVKTLLCKSDLVFPARCLMHVLHRFRANVLDRGLAAKVNLEALVQHEINGAPEPLLSPANSVYYKSTCS